MYIKLINMNLKDATILISIRIHKCYYVDNFNIEFSIYM